MTSSALFLLVGCLSIGIPRPSSSIVIDEPSLCSVTHIFEAWPFIASSMELSRISQTRWCRPALPTPPMYMPGRRRTGSRPSRTVMSFAVYAMNGVLTLIGTRPAPIVPNARGKYECVCYRAHRLHSLITNDESNEERKGWGHATSIADSLGRQHSCECD